jgi:hypothetical protein
MVIITITNNPKRPPGVHGVQRRQGPGGLEQPPIRAAGAEDELPVLRPHAVAGRDGPAAERGDGGLERGLGLGGGGAVGVVWLRGGGPEDVLGVGGKGMWGFVVGIGGLALGLKGHVCTDERG